MKEAPVFFSRVRSVPGTGVNPRVTAKEPASSGLSQVSGASVSAAKFAGLENDRMDSVAGTEVTDAT